MLYVIFHSKSWCRDPLSVRFQVDAHNVNRLGPAADWLGHAENVVVYDHHAGATGDINFDELHTAEVADGCAAEAKGIVLRLAHNFFLGCSLNFPEFPQNIRKL